MKKLLSVIISLALLPSMAACGQSEKPASGTKKIGIIQLLDNGAFADMREGFIAQIRALGYTEEKLTIDYKNAQGEVGNLNSICQSMADAGMDLIVTIATPPTQAMVNLESGVPVFFISVSDPLGAGVITDLAKPDKNATGTSNAIPVDEIFKLSDQLTPGMKRYGVIYNTGEVNSTNTARMAKEYLEGQGLEYKEVIVTASSEVQQAAQSLVGSVDAIFVPNDSMVQAALPQVAEVCREAKIPLYGSSAVMVDSGAFATISIDDVTIGSMTADMVFQYLEGTAIEEIPAVVVSEFTTVINKATAEAIGADLNQDILDNAVII